MMCDSLETPIVDQPQAGVIEVNASPGLRMHHFPLQGQPRNVAGKILDMVQEKL
jgi:cyanophycin synthetase